MHSVLLRQRVLFSFFPSNLPDSKSLFFFTSFSLFFLIYFSLILLRFNRTTYSTSNPQKDTFAKYVHLSSEEEEGGAENEEKFAMNTKLCSLSSFYLDWTSSPVPSGSKRQGRLPLRQFEYESILLAYLLS